MTGMAIWVAVAVFMPVGVVGLAQDFNLSRAIAVEHVRRLAVSAQPRAVERVDAQKDEQADETDQHERRKCNPDGHAGHGHAAACEACARRALDMGRSTRTSAVVHFCSWQRR